ncbi:MAG: glycosyltransferase family 39 protein, partial [Acidobacteria bacterium]|nr:glycosyltransferase family 39 protein [Acidobacteriota bacterium]
MIRRLPRSTIPIGGLLLLALIPRVYMLFKFRTALVDWDEAVVGLMARHILRGELPIFYYGQYYMGTLEAFLAALLFAVFGAEPLVLKIAPLIPFCGFLIVHFFLAQRIAGRRVAFLATLLLAVSPAFLTIWSLKARGGYTILLLLGTSALLIASRMLEQGYRRRDAALLGIVLGLAWWTHFLSVVYLFPIILLLLLRDEKKCFGPAGLCFAGAFLAGSLPFWIFNIQHPAASLGIGGARQTSYLADLANIFSTGLPIILSARPNWGRPGTDFLPWASVITTALFFVSLTAVFTKLLRAGSQSGHASRLQLLATFAGLFPLLLSSTGFASFMLEPRYLIPLYSAIYILILTAVAARSAQMVLCGLLLVL